MTVRLNKEGKNSRISDFFGHFGLGCNPPPSPLPGYFGQCNKMKYSCEALERQLRKK